MTETEWRELAKRIDNEAACLIKDVPPKELVTVYFNDGDKLVFNNTEAVEVWQTFEDYK
jgi:hypothetical protein